MDISRRQQQLLLTIIQEFIESAEAVGSISLQSKYNFKVSPATIRNEMSQLVDRGYLFQKHNSGGRIPTTKGWRYFIDDLMVSIPVDISDQEKELLRARLYTSSTDKVHLLKEAIGFLAKYTENAAVAILEDNVFYSGLSDMVNIPEFREFDNLRKVLALLEDYNTLSEIMNKGNSDNDLNILIGEESERTQFEGYAVIFSEIRFNGNKIGYIAVIGPTRMRYDRAISAVKHITKTIREIVTT